MVDRSGRGAPMTTYGVDTTRTSAPRRVAMLSLHTSPLDAPGSGDAGGMNVYVAELSRELVARGIAVEVFTRRVASNQPAVVRLPSGVLVRHVLAGPYGNIDKGDLQSRICEFAAAVMRVEATQGPHYFDVLHSHYWLSGQAGLVVRSRWGIPLVHSAHTLARVKNRTVSADDVPEPLTRIAGEDELAQAADVLVANAEDEAAALVGLYDADPSRLRVVHPGVDLTAFAPGDRLAARRMLGLPDGAQVLLFAGRIQPLKAPDVLVRAAAMLRAQDRRRPLLVAIVGGPSGSGAARLPRLRQLVTGLGLDSVVRFAPPADRERLAQWYRAADVVVVPSRSESFGLVALEAQASGTPVVAAAVGGLRTAVADERSGLLVPGHDPRLYAAALHRVLDEPGLHARLRSGALEQASRFSWSRTAEGTVRAYAAAAERLLPRHALAIAT